tara:strand:- start:690 stop:1778 length:1089 start_codon:yes stop_codon:yes gene_type:complete
MLFHYAIEATEENWVHDSIVAILDAGMDQIDIGGQPQGWPNCLPPEHQNKLSTRTGIRDHSQRFFEKYASYNNQDRQRIRSALSSQNALPDIFDGASARITLEQLPVDAREVIKKFFEYAFDLLTAVGLRDQHYRSIFKRLPRKFCPFCGLERLSAPGQPRHDLDHYLAITVYPFAAANLRNLAPMGDRCNKSFKRKADIVFDAETNTRRKCCDPYLGPDFGLELNESELLNEGEAVRSQPTWSIVFTGGDNDCAATWDSTFQIRKRYADVLNDEYASWLRSFAVWCGHPANVISITDVPSAVASLDHYVDLIEIQGLDDSNFLKRAVFGMLRDQCRDGPNAEVIANWLAGMVNEFAIEEAA